MIYYAIAQETSNPVRFGVLRVVKEPGKPIQQEFTGERYDRQPDAERAMIRLNEALFGVALV